MCVSLLFSLWLTHKALSLLLFQLSTQALSSQMRDATVEQAFIPKLNSPVSHTKPETLTTGFGNYLNAYIVESVLWPEFSFILVIRIGCNHSLVLIKEQFLTL